MKHVCIIIYYSRVKGNEIIICTKNSHDQVLADLFDSSVEIIVCNLYKKLGLHQHL